MALIRAVFAQTTSPPTVTPLGGTPGEVDVPRPGWLPGWIPTWMMDVVVAALLLVAAWYLSRKFSQVLSRRIARRFRRPSVTRTILRSIRAAIMLLSGFLALNVLGLHIGNIALSVTVFSAVMGFILAPIIGSVVNGLFVLSSHAYEIGDMVEIADRGQQGFIEDITLRYTKIFTLDNTFLVISNGNMRDRDIINYSAEDSRTRLSLDVLVTYESDVERARTAIERAARDVEKVIEGGPDIRIGSARYPAAPTCYINEFADHGILFTLRYWASEPYRLLSLRSQVQTNVYQRLQEEDVEFAYPHQHHIFDETSGELSVALGERGTNAGVTDVEPADVEPADADERGAGQGPS
ncbi:MAG: mechanosensitive ion channel family protein [Haloarculaceae archaeon]